MSLLHVFAEFPNVSVVAAGYELGTGRLVPTTAAVVGLISAVAGGLAWRRMRRRSRDSGRNGAIVSLVLGLLGVVVGGLHGANAAGGLGTGNGLAGAIFAVALGLAGIVLGALVLTRARQTT